MAGGRCGKRIGERCTTPGEELGSRCTKSATTTTYDTGGGEIRMSREIVRPRKAAETGGEGGAKISCNH